MMLYYKYKYNGKEYQDELGLNMYDYGFRNYMPDLGRWFNVDPLAENYYDNSGYVYVKNSPLTNIDPDGRYLFGLFGSTSSERKLGRAEKYAKKTGGILKISENGSPMVNTSSFNSSGELVINTKTSFGDFSSWKNFKETMNGMDSAMQGSGGNEYTGTQGMMEFGEDLGKSSSYVKGTGALITASSIVLGPEVIPVGIAVYDIGSGMDDVSTGLSIINNFSKDNNTEAVKESAFLLLGKGADKTIDKVIPQTSDKVGNTLLKYTTDKINNKMKENTKNGHNN